MPHHGITHIAIILIIASSPGVLFAGDQDAATLLRGVEESRKAIRTGKIELVYETNQFIPPWPKGSPFYVQIEFDGDKRTCVQQMRAIVANDSAGDSSKVVSQIMAMQDYDEAVKEGLARWEDKTLYSTWDGANFFQYGVKFGASFRKHHSGTPEYMYDPRMLGLFCIDPFVDTLERALPYREGADLNYIGLEEVEGVNTHHVSVKPHPKIEFHYWIEPERGFRVHRFEYRASYRTEVRVSRFVDDEPLPREVISTSYLPDRKVSRESTVRVSTMKLNMKASPHVGTPQAIDMPPGEVIADERTGQQLGFWDGMTIVDNYEASVAIGQERAAAAIRKQRWRWGSVIAAIGIALIAISFGIRRRQRGANHGSRP